MATTSMTYILIVLVVANLFRLLPRASLNVVVCGQYPTGQSSGDFETYLNCKKLLNLLMRLRRRIYVTKYHALLNSYPAEYCVCSRII